VSRHPQLEIVAPGASPQEAAAVVAALERFMRDTSLASPSDAGQELGAASRWKRAALAEGVRRGPDLPATWE
jgi:hypothetical protein